MVIQDFKANIFTYFLIIFYYYCCFNLFLNLFFVIVWIIAPSELICFVCKLTLNKTSYVLCIMF